MNLNHNELLNAIQAAVELRLRRFPLEPNGALRLFNGFYESNTDLVVDLYARTLVISNHEDPPGILGSSAGRGPGLPSEKVAGY